MHDKIYRHVLPVQKVRDKLCSIIILSFLESVLVKSKRAIIHHLLFAM